MPKLGERPARSQGQSCDTVCTEQRLDGVCGCSAGVRPRCVRPREDGRRERWWHATRGSDPVEGIAGEACARRDRKERAEDVTAVMVPERKNRDHANHRTNRQRGAMNFEYRSRRRAIDGRPADLLANIRAISAQVKDCRKPMTIEMIQTAKASLTVALAMPPIERRGQRRYARRDPESTLQSRARDSLPSVPDVIRRPLHLSSVKFPEECFASTALCTSPSVCRPMAILSPASDHLPVFPHVVVSRRCAGVEIIFLRSQPDVTFFGRSVGSCLSIGARALARVQSDQQRDTTSYTRPRATLEFPPCPRALNATGSGAAGRW